MMTSSDTIQPISECEEMIMSVLWKNTDLNVVEITELLKLRFGKDWKLQTVCTFLTRLKSKGYINIYKRGRYSYYIPLIKIEDYQRYKIEYLNNILFDGKNKSLLKMINNIETKEHPQSSGGGKIDNLMRVIYPYNQFYRRIS